VIPEPIEVLVVTPLGDVIKIVGAGQKTGQVHQRVLRLDQLQFLDATPEREPFDGDPDDATPEREPCDGDPEAAEAAGLTVRAIHKGLTRAPVREFFFESMKPVRIAAKAQALHALIAELKGDNAAARVAAARTLLEEDPKPALAQGMPQSGQGGYDGNTDRHGSHGRYEASVRSGRRRGRGEGGGAFQEADRRRLTDPGKSFGSRPTPSHPNVHPIPRLAGTSGNRLRLGTHPVSDRVHEIGKHVAAIRNVDHFDAGHHPEQRTEPSFSAATPNSSKLRLTLI
jgi:hypothetical protein